MGVGVFSFFSFAITLFCMPGKYSLLTQKHLPSVGGPISLSNLFTVTENDDGWADDQFIQAM